MKVPSCNIFLGFAYDGLFDKNSVLNCCPHENIILKEGCIRFEVEYKYHLTCLTVF